MGHSVFGDQKTKNPIASIINSGYMSVTSTNKYGYAYGILARTQGADSGICSITNSATLVVTGNGDNGARATGIFGLTNSSDSPLSIVNSGDMTVTAAFDSAPLCGCRLWHFRGYIWQQQSHRHRELRRPYRHRNRDRQ